MVFSLKVIPPPNNTSVTEMYVGYSTFLRKRTCFDKNANPNSASYICLEMNIIPKTKPNPAQQNLRGIVHLGDILFLVLVVLGGQRRVHHFFVVRTNHPVVHDGQMKYLIIKKYYIMFQNIIL